MNRPTEYIVLKRMIDGIKDFSDALTWQECVALKQDSCVDALERLSDADREQVEKAAKVLNETVKRRGCGPKGSLEVLAAIGDVLRMEAK